MEKISSLNLDFDRVLIQLIIPGLTGVFPFLIIFLNHYHFERDFLYKNLTLFIPLISILSLIMGIVLENIGSYVEVKYYDEKNKKNEKIDPNYEDTWKKFLALNYGAHQPAGHRYLRNILLRMKFELSFGFALIFMAGGLIILDNQHPIFESNCPRLFFLYLIPFFAFCWLVFKDGYDSSKVLAQTRKILVDEYYIKPNCNLETDKK